MSGFNPFQNAGGSRIKPVRMLMSETGQYLEQFYRPFETNIQGDAIRALTESTRGGKHITRHSLSDLAGSILTPSADVEGNVRIAEGWTMRRFRFILTVKEASAFQTSGDVTRVFYGYTDHCDTSLGQHLDPNMRVYFNSEVVMQDRYIQTPNGPVSRPVVMTSNQIINGYSQDEVMGTNNLIHTLRPEDIFTCAESTAVANRLASTGEFGDQVDGHFGPGGLQVNDMRSRFAPGGEQKFSNRHDSSPVNYLVRTFDGYRQVLNSSDEMMDTENLMTEAASAVANSFIYRNEFLNTLRSRTNYAAQGYVTYGQLCSIFEGIDQVNRVAINDGRSIRSLSNGTDSVAWNGRDSTTIAASLLAQTVPGIMMDCMMTNVQFQAVNGHGYGQFNVIINPDSVFMVVEGMDPSHYIQRFIDRLSVEVLIPISQNNAMGFKLSMATDVIGESVIDLAMDGQGHDRFVAPTFADSSFTSLVTSDSNRQSKISNDLTYLVQNIIPSPFANFAENFVSKEEPSFDNGDLFGNQQYGIYLSGNDQNNMIL